MPVNDIIGAVIGSIELTIAAMQLILFTYLISGGWVTILRSIGFFLDQLLVGFIAKVFEYFELIVSKELIVPAVVDGITDNVYFFIAIIILFKLAIRFMKYIMDPTLVEDHNMGTNAIIKRTIVGMCLIIFIPSIFSLIRDFQSAIISDDIVNKVIMDDVTTESYNALKERAPVGRIIGFSVLQGFLNYDETKYKSSLTKNQWNNAMANFDAAEIKINTGSSGFSDNYHYDYFPIISTIALCYTLYLIIKYCFDVLVRFFKLTILQIISPIVMVDYIIDGGEQGTFKNWLTTVMSTFAMLFIRILSLSFVVMVCIQMQMTHQDCIDNYVDNTLSVEEQDDARIACDNSLLYKDNEGNVDQLLRAGIIIALLAFSMDLPKILGSIFGLDLEQESSVTGMIQKVGGVGKMVGLGGLAFGGGLIGGAIGGLKSGLNVAANWGANKRQTQSKMNALEKSKDRQLAGLDPKAQDYAQRKAEIMDRYNRGVENVKHEETKNNYRAASQLSAATRGMALGGLMAAASKSSAVSSAVGGYQSANQTTTNGAGVKQSPGFIGAMYDAEDNVEARERQISEQESMAAFQQHQMQTADAQLSHMRAMQVKVGGPKEIDVQVEDDGYHAMSDALKDVAGDNSILGNLNTANQTLKATQKATVEIGQDVNVIRTNTANIQDNTEVIANSTMNVEQNVEKIVNQNENIKNTLNRNEENTMITAINSIEELDLKGYTSSANNSSDTLGGVPVSKPDPTIGERKTSSGIIVTGDVDKK